MPVAEKVKKKGKHKTAPSPEQEEAANGNAVCLWANNTGLFVLGADISAPESPVTIFSPNIIKSFCFPLFNVLFLFFLHFYNGSSTVQYLT